MSERKRKKELEKRKKIIFIFLSVGFGLIAFFLFAGFFNKLLPAPSIYISSENVKQGDTVFIKIKSQADEISGSFGQEKLVFYKKPGTSEWISFLGIDADQKPGDYKISVDTSNAGHITKKIKVSLADFSLAASATAPKAVNGTAVQTAVYNIRNKDNPAINKFLSKLTAKPYFSSPFSFPLSEMETSGFSFGKFIGFGKSLLQHLGVDLRASEKTDIYAINDGKVVATLDLSNYGKTVIIDHGLDIFSMYLHLDKFKVSEGQMVKKGQIIGLSGDTGYVTAPHLHFSVRVDGTRVDPVAFIKTSQQMDDNFIAANVSNAFLNILSWKQ